MSDTDIIAKRARLAEIDAMLARLRARHDMLMNAFKFDEAKAVSAEIEVGERERAALAATLPPPPEPRPGQPFTVSRRRPTRR